MSKGSDFLEEFEREWFAESGIDPTPDDLERLRGTAYHARARLHAGGLDFSETVNVLAIDLARAWRPIWKKVGWVVRITDPGPVTRASRGFRRNKYRRRR